MRFTSRFLYAPSSGSRSTVEVSHPYIANICLARSLYSALSSHVKESRHVKAFSQRSQNTMAEAVAALSIAANVVQFIDFSGKILSEGYRLHKSKRVSSSKNEELENIALDLQKLRDELQSQQEEKGQTLTPNDIQLQRLANQCRGVCLELLGALETLKVVDKPGKWESFRAALKTVWAESKIKSLQDRLDEARQELIVRILVSFR